MQRVLISVHWNAHNYFCFESSRLNLIIFSVSSLWTLMTHFIRQIVHINKFQTLSYDFCH